MAARGKTTRKKTTTKKPARAKAIPHKITARKTSSKPKTPTIEALARKIVRATQNPANVKLEDLYAETCISHEPGSGAPSEGLEALENKFNAWTAMCEEQTWNSVHVWAKGHTIAIQWEAVVKLRDGRTVQLDEVAVHEVRGGKIVAERFYYDPSIFAPPKQAQPEAPPPSGPVLGPEPNPPIGSPPLDPIDL